MAAKGDNLYLNCTLTLLVVCAITFYIKAMDLTKQVFSSFVVQLLLNISLASITKINEILF